MVCDFRALISPHIQICRSTVGIMSLRFNSDGTFRVLQMADIQDGPDVREDTIRLIEAAIRKAHPDLIVLTGDQIRGYDPAYIDTFLRRRGEQPGTHVRAVTEIEAKIRGIKRHPIAKTLTKSQPSDERWMIDGIGTDSPKLVKSAGRNGSASKLESWAEAINRVTAASLLDETRQKVRDTFAAFLGPALESHIPFAATYGNHDFQCGILADEQDDLYREFAGCMNPVAGSSPLALEPGTFALPIEASDGSGRITMSVMMVNSGDYAAGLSDDEVRQASRICEKGLRYDLTVPFARYVVQHQGELTFPFKRYQVQPVWRADRPQKGRYREFYQCDVDVIGTRSLLCEVELIEIVERVFRALGIRVALKMNNRKILFGIAEAIGHADKMMDITVAIDKLEKIGLDNVKAELLERGLGQEAVDKLQPILELSGDNSQKLTKLREVLAVSETGLKGIEEMETVFGYVQRSGIGLTVELDLSLARGLNYYTGAIFEVKALDFAIGSICGGGRYDDLTGIFGMPNMSGVGISFGADRIYDVMTGLNLFPEEVSFTTRVFFTNLGAEEEAASLQLLRSLRDAGVAAEIYPECGKMKKQMEYANRRSIPYVVIIGSQELEAQAATVKDMRSGEQRQVPFAALAADLESRR